MRQLQKLSVFGLGKLGACMAATFAQKGFEVVGVDINAEAVRKINAGQPPVEEPLLAEVMKEAHPRLRASTDARDAASTDASFFIVPSPSQPDGSFSNEFLMRAMESVARAVRESGKKGHLFVCSSTTTPGACDSVLIPMLEKEIGGKCGEDFGFCYNPEFIALGNVVRGLLEPDMVLIGESDAASGAALEALYRKYNTNQPRISRMSVISAELTKISVNSYITLKISFTNQLRLIAERFPKADIHTILGAIGSDTRINSKYLRAGLSYGGPCFPRDNRLLAYTAKQVGLVAPLAEASDVMNERTKHELLEHVQRLAKPGEAVAVLGMSYKPDTYITEESAGLFLAQQLKRRGYDVWVHDFCAKPANSPNLFEFKLIEDLSVFTHKNTFKAAVVCCPWPQYNSLTIAAGTSVIAPWQR
ncbi:MAG: nucleotide sugar dehydrogenase [Verrucomicrobiota bacterium]